MLEPLFYQVSQKELWHLQPDAETTVKEAACMEAGNYETGREEIICEGNMPKILIVARVQLIVVYIYLLLYW